VPKATGEIWLSRKPGDTLKVVLEFNVLPAGKVLRPGIEYVSLTANVVSGKYAICRNSTSTNASRVFWNKKTW